MFRCFTFIVLVFGCLNAVSQTDFTTYVVPLDYDSISIRVEVLNEYKKINVSNEREYFWFKSRGIHNSVGDYDGKLLHGIYKSSYTNKQLKEKGAYKYGLKTGEWKQWYPDGQLKSSAYWKNGFLHGKSILNDSTGVLLKETSYFKGQLHGTTVFYENGDEVLRTEYKKGAEKVKKERPPKVKKEKPVKEKESKEEKKKETPAKNKDKKKKEKGEKSKENTTQRV